MPASREAAEDLLELFFRTTEDYALIVLDQDAVVVRWNPGAERLCRSGLRGYVKVVRDFTERRPRRRLRSAGRVCRSSS